MALSPTAARIFDSLPPYYGGDPTLARIVQGIANEIDRCEAYLISVQNGLVPTLADDSLGMLSIWEGILGLPIAPPSESLAVRQQAVQAAMVGRRCRTTAEWVNAMNTLLGSTTWSYQVGVPSTGEITITTTFPSTSYFQGVIAVIARRLIPANYLIAGASGGSGGGSGTGHFIVGISAVGDVI
jgi:hypothetical protein